MFKTYLVSNNKIINYHTIIKTKTIYNPLKYFYVLAQGAMEINTFYIK